MYHSCTSTRGGSFSTPVALCKVAMQANCLSDMLSPTSMSDTEPLQELSPAYNSFDNTDVKVPVMSRLIEPQCTIPVCDNPDASYTCSPEDIGQPSRLTETQLQQLNVYFNGYPRIMFKDALLKLYASCDRKLAEVRGDLFTLVSKMPGYPYPGSALTRRLQSRTGDTLAEKLAFDIHTLLSVLEGLNFRHQNLKKS